MGFAPGVTRPPTCGIDKIMEDEFINGLYTDRYELAMALAYWREGRAGESSAFDYFFRRCPFDGGYVAFAGLETLLDALDGFRFDGDSLDFLKRDGFPDGFLEYLEDFAFQGDIHAPPEGELVFPLETVLRVEGGLVEAQLAETLVLNVLNFQSLVATKASRCRRSAGGRGLSEFGLRRAQGLGGLWAARAACIGGFDTTSNTAAAHAYGLPATGTMAHSFVQSYDDELEAFRAFARSHGDATVLLLDTYDTLKSGLPNAIRVARELADAGQSLKGVRLDSGDLAYLSQKVRAALDEAGLTEVKIVASNQLDEHVIRSLLEQDARIDLFGVGTDIAVGRPDAALDGVYKLSQTGDKPRLKASESVEKSTFPGLKSVSRYYDTDGKMAADAIHFADEDPPGRMFHPFEPGRSLDLSALRSRPLLEPVLRAGRRLADGPGIDSARDVLGQALDSLPAEHKRFENPHLYKVGLSARLRDRRDELLNEKRKAIES